MLFLSEHVEREQPAASRLWVLYTFVAGIAFGLLFGYLLGSGRIRGGGLLPYGVRGGGRRT